MSNKTNKDIKLPTPQPKIADQKSTDESNGIKVTENILTLTTKSPTVLVPTSQAVKRLSRHKGSTCIAVTCPVQKCPAEGVFTRNPFLNYLCDYRKTHCGITMVQIAIDGGKRWNAMTYEEKWPYILQAYNTRKRQHSSSIVDIFKTKAIKRRKK